MQSSETSLPTAEIPPSLTNKETLNRADDALAESAHSRSERIFSNEDLWYFKTREGNDVGPFRYRSEAETNLSDFLEHLENRLR